MSLLFTNFEIRNVSIIEYLNGLKKNTNFQFERSLNHVFPTAVWLGVHSIYPQYAFSLSNQENKFCCICFFKMIFLAAPVPSLWSRIKEFLSASLLVGGMGYAIYQLYKVRTVLVHFLSKKIIVTQCNGDKPLKECSRNEIQSVTKSRTGIILY